MASSYQEPVVVIGLGRFGEALALELVRRGTEVLGVDGNPAVVQRLSGQLPHLVVADSTDLAALHEIGVPDFSRAVVSIGTDQQASILTTSLLAELEIDSIWAKATSQQHGRILERVGAHHVVFPEHDMGERIAHLVSGRMLDYMEVDRGFALVKTTPPQYLVGVPLGESRLRSKRGVTVMAVSRETGGSGFAYAGVDTVLGYGDLILVAGHPDDLDRFVDSR